MPTRQQRHDNLVAIGRCEERMRMRRCGSLRSHSTSKEKSRKKQKKRLRKLETALQEIRGCHHRDEGSHNEHVHGIIDAVLTNQAERPKEE